MRVHVRLFAVLRERAGGVSELTLELREGSTVSTARDAIVRQIPAIATMVSRVAFAVNREYAGVETVLREGDEVALIPPVSGG